MYLVVLTGQEKSRVRESAYQIGIKNLAGTTTLCCGMIDHYKMQALCNYEDI